MIVVDRQRKNVIILSSISYILTLKDKRNREIGIAVESIKLDIWDQYH